jgi:hypothetical protein
VARRLTRAGASNTRGKRAGVGFFGIARKRAGVEAGPVPVPDAEPVPAGERSGQR